VDVAGLDMRYLIFDAPNGQGGCWLNFADLRRYIQRRKTLFPDEAEVLGQIDADLVTGMVYRSDETPLELGS